MRSEPPRSVPSASAIIPVASAAHPPPVEPPALNAGSHGLRVRPNTSLKVFPPAANSGQLVLPRRSEEHTSELQSRLHLVCRLLLEKKKYCYRKCHLQR